ncbi:hypothetical protein [Niallia sp. 01092]|uniref:hypothetical protein n=1 Tax=unclassified Niallia TaxID=2837522 RepID=UPI003FD4295F
MPDKKEQSLFPTVYKPKTKLEDSSNQKTFHQNYLHDYMQSQHDTMDKLTHLILDLQQFVKDNQHVQQGKFDGMNQKLLAQESLSSNLLTSFANHQLMSKSFQEKLLAIECLIKENANVLANETIMNQAILDQVSYQEQAVISLGEQFQNYTFIANQMQKNMEKVDKNYETVTEKLEVQEIFHQTLIEKMDATEANMSKITRQIDVLKHLLFERISYLSDKLEANFKSISKPVQRFLLQKEKQD